MVEEYTPLLKNKNFIYIWISQILSQLTINIMNFLLLTRLFSETGSSIATSLLWVSYALPAILVGPFAAASVDMISRKKILVTTNFLQALTVAFYALTHQTRIFLPYGVAFLYSLLNQFYVPAESATLPGVVDKKYYPQANGMFFVTQQISLVIGFAVGGFFNSLLGFGNSIFLCSILLFLAYISVSFLPETKVEVSLPERYEDALGKFFSRILDGYKFIKNTPSVLFPFSIMLALQISLAITVVNVPAIASEIFRINANLLGAFIVIPAGLGAVSATFITSKILKTGLRKKRLIEYYFTLLSICFALLIFALNGLPDLIRPLTGSLILYVIGMAFVGIVIITMTVLQEATPGGYRGRVFGNIWFLVTIATIIPVILSGAITELFGTRLLLGFMAIMSGSGLFFSRKYGQRILRNGFKMNKAE